MFNFAALVAFVSLAISVSGAPLEIRQEVSNAAITNARLSTVNKTSIKQKAAAYFITNEDTGNFVVVMDINTEDGKLTLARAISTGGSGNHGLAKGPDALFSQGAIKVSPNGEFLVAVNAGSNTVSMLSIDRQNPSILKLIGEPVATGGEFPVSVAVHPDNSMVCVLNGGAINGVQCFNVDKQTGLKAIANTNRSLNQKGLTTSPTGPAKTVSHIIFNQDGKSLLASVKGDDKDPGFVAVWEVKVEVQPNVRTRTGTRTLSEQFKKITVPTGAKLPFGMAVVPDKNAILATDAAIGFSVLNLSATANDQFGGNSNVVEIKGQNATCWVAHSSKTDHFYVSDIGTSKVTEVSVDKDLKGKVVKTVQLKANSFLLDLAIASTNKKDFLYVLAAGQLAVDVMQINGANDFKSVQTLDFGKPAKKAKLAINKDNVMGMATVVINQ